MKRLLSATILFAVLVQTAGAGISFVRANGITLTGADGITLTGADGITLTGADGILNYTTNGITLTGADGVPLTVSMRFGRSVRTGRHTRARTE